MLITIGSLPGAGSSTVAKLLAEKLSKKRIDAGEIWDLMAKDKDMSVLELNKFAENNPEVDHELDERMIQTAKENNDIILESRLIGQFCHQKNVEAFKIWLTAKPEIRIERLQEAGRGAEKVTEREASEKKRYKSLYNIDIGDFSMYDLVVNTDTILPEEIVSIIIEKYSLSN